MTLRRCWNIQDHIDRVGIISPDVVAIYFGARIAELANDETPTCHSANSFTRFRTVGLVETVAVAPEPAPAPVVYPKNHVSQGEIS